MIKKFISRFKVGFVAAALLFVVTSQSCDDSTTSVTSCTGCNSTNPWSKASSSSCYATFTACTNALGSGCVICY